MADTISSDRRSKIMSHIKSKDTSIEMMVRRRLFAMGYRYRVNYKALPGKPDIVFTKKKIAIFIHGCYWHGHDCGSRYAHTSQSNRAYWAQNRADKAAGSGAYSRAGSPWVEGCCALGMSNKNEFGRHSSKLGR